MLIRWKTRDTHSSHRIIWKESKKGKRLDEEGRMKMKEVGELKEGREEN